MKKGAYDLGRKAVYYIVVIIIIAILFVYISNSFRKYQIVRLSTLDELADLAVLNNVVKCVSQKDTDTGRVYLYKIDESKLSKDELTKCLGTNKLYTNKAVRIKINGKELVETQKPFFKYLTYKRTAEYKNNKTELEISIEKSTKVI